MLDWLLTLDVREAAELLAASLSCAGAYLVSRYGHERLSMRGWAAWSASNLLWIGFAFSHKHYGQALMYVYFFWTSVMGLWRASQSLSERSSIGKTAPLVR